MEDLDGVVEVYENDIDMYCKMFCEENNIQDLRAASQAVFNCCLHYIQKKVFPDRKKLKDKNIYKMPNNNILTNNNRYDYELVNKILDIYIYDLCLKYDKEVSIIGFSTFTSIDRMVLQTWRDDKPGSPTYCITKKLIDFNEESLSDKLATGNKNPVGIIAILNRRHGWASPYTSDANRQQANASLTAAELPRLPAEPQNIIDLPAKEDI